MKLDYTRRMQMLEIGKISSIPTQQKYVLSVERQQKIKEELFLYLLNKRGKKTPCRWLWPTVICVLWTGPMRPEWRELMP